MGNRGYMSRKQKITAALLTAIVVICIAVVAVAVQDPAALSREKDQEYAAGSGIRIEQVSGQQTENLYKLGKVWGFVKYHHPSVVDGSLNWDAELFRVLPKMLEAAGTKEANVVLERWLKQFPITGSGYDQEAAEWLALQEESGFESLDTSWILDEDFLGREVSRYLQELSQTHITEREHGFAAFSEEMPGVSFAQEMYAGYVTGDDGVGLLALFRFWNIYEYYSPNVRITKTHWDTVLKEAIPGMVAVQNYRDYVLEIARVAALTGDAHIGISDKYRTVWNYYGKYYLPCSFESVEGQIVVSAIEKNTEEQPLLCGDIITEINGISMGERMQTLRKYMALSEEDKFMQHFPQSLLNSDQTTAAVTVIRDGAEQELQVKTRTKPFVGEHPHQNGLLEQGQIGYLDLSAVKKGDIERLMEEFADTKGLVVDLRYYPNPAVMAPYLLGEYLTPEPRQFAKVTMPNPALPGSFYEVNDFYSGAGWLRNLGGEETYPAYEGKVALLMNEHSQSHAEFTIMALRQSPNAVVIGSPSNGADGNVAEVELSGGVSMKISGLGVYTSEGRQTQRVGLQPDILCYPTVEGLRDGRDELLEKAIAVLLE